MKRKRYTRIFNIVLVAFLLLSGGSSPFSQGVAGGAATASESYVPGEVLVKFSTGVAVTAAGEGSVTTGSASLDSILQEIGVTNAIALFADVENNTQGLERIFRLTLRADADLMSAIEALGANAHVDYAEPNYRYSIAQTTVTSVRPADDAPPPPLPSDPFLPNLWGLHNEGQTGGVSDADIDAPEAWTITKGSQDFLVAVIDTGVDYTHEELNDGRVRTDIDWDYANNDGDAMDDHGHGTHVAGTIGAASNNGLGVAGVMWDVQILPLKALDHKGSGTIDNIASAIRYAADHGARVINMSLGGSNCSQTLADAVNYAYFDKGVTLVAAAGNSGGSIGYPAKYPPVIAVGAVDHRDLRAYFSSFGDALDVVAPGVTVFSTVPNNSYDAFSGTSMASPHVAGVAGLLLAQRPELTNAQVRAILRQSADDKGQIGFDRYYGYGRVNAHSALLLDTPTTVPAPDRAQCPNEGCAATVALASEPSGDDVLFNLRAVRDKVFVENPGKRWTQIYYQYQWEVAWIVLTDAQVRADATAGFLAFDPVFRSLLSDDPDEVVILTPELVDAANKALMGVAERGNPEMRAAIQREWARVDPSRFLGWDVRDVWEQLRVEDQTPSQIYLPYVTR